MSLFQQERSGKLLKVLPYIVIALGVILRIVVYLQNRSLIIDEANIARNLFERGFTTLLQPLSYEQYAPPLFLYIEELATLLGGFSEYILRFYPLLSGIAVLLLLYQVLKDYAEDNAVWYALILLATGPIYLRYSTEVKQYMPDAMVALALILFALRRNILTMPATRFALFWAVAGSIAIWLSMPAVFMLFTIGLYYCYILWQANALQKISPLAIAGILWAAQFAWYYFAVLQDQATSGYLQNFHKEYFLYFLPTNGDALMHNWEIVVMKVLGNAAGHWALSIIFHLACIIAGLVYLLRRHTAKAILLVVPVLLMLLAAALQRYSLIPRLTLFAMPLLLVLIAAGLSRLFLMSRKWMSVVYIVLAIICINNFNAVGDVATGAMRYEEMKQSLHFLQQAKIDGPQLYVHHLAQPAFTYYTQIHPQHSQFAFLQNAHMLQWGMDYAALSREMPPHAALLYGWQEEGETSAQVNTLLDNGLKIANRNDVPGGIVFIFTRQ
jgi:4-amino-4-deoxy-L-arabinose transferase-like glycosyltransferase